MPKKLENLIGQTFNRLTVIEMYGYTKERRRIWKCICVCKNEKLVCTKHLKNGSVASCGCLQKETTRKNIEKSEWFKKHATNGYVGHPLYSCYQAMKNRCYNNRHEAYMNYGGRGIKVCERWLESFSNFKIDMETTWKQGLTLDRIDNNGNYSPENCRWATYREQANNTRRSKNYEYNGQNKTLTSWAREYGINPTTLHSRVKESHMSLEKALSSKKFNTHGKIIEKF